jgi:hypothetical protein
MLFYKTDKSNWSVLVTFLVYLNRMPDKLDNIISTDIPLDEVVVKKLREI